MTHEQKKKLEGLKNDTLEDMDFEMYDVATDEWQRGKNAGIRQCQFYFNRFITNLNKILNEEEEQ